VLLITDCLRQAEKRKMRHYGHLITVPRVSKLLKGIAKRQKQEEVWDNLGRTTNLNPMATALRYFYANLSLLFARYQESDEDEDEGRKEGRKEGRWKCISGQGRTPVGNDTAV
jgi:hypothetical protein